jgi:hypothetical protein
MFKQVTALAAAMALCASTAFAGGLSPEIIEAAPAEEAVAPAFAINPAYVVLGAVALLLIVSAGRSDDTPDEEVEVVKEKCLTQEWIGTDYCTQG